MTQLIPKHILHNTIIWKKEKKPCVQINLKITKLKKTKQFYFLQDLAAALIYRHRINYSQF